MSRAVVFAYAVADGLTPVVGAAPYDVLARQLPRLLVTRLNGDGDRGVRFFPFVGPVDGTRSFLRLRELLDASALTKLHRQDGVELLVDGLLTDGLLVWRVTDDATGDERMRLELPFDPLDPLAVLPRLEFELAGLFGWTGHKPEPPLALGGDGLGWYLVAKDELLRFEARLPTASPDPLRSVRRCVELVARDDDVQQLVLDFLALLLRRGQHREQVAEVARELAPSVRHPARLDRLAGLTYAAGEQRAAVGMLVEAAVLAPENADLVERAAALAFRAGDDGSVERVVAAGRAAGAATPKMIAQLAASYDRAGDLVGRQRLVEELLGQGDLPVPVARLVVSFLLEEEQPALARTVIERALTTSPDHGMLHFELGRACLMLDDVARASLALQRALELGLPASVEDQAVRLRRLSLVPGLWQGTQLVEKALAAGDLGAAREAARALVRRLLKNAEAWLMYGVVEHKRGRSRRAERALRRAVGLHDECGDAHNRLGVVLLQSGRTAEGLRHLERAHALMPHDTSTLLHLAQAAALSGQHERAARHVAAAARFGADAEVVAAVEREVRSARDSA